jgi:sporulation protein YlmC with PRC-barrel domain
MPAGRVLYAHLHLLDRQVVDPNDRMVCKVDDLELTLDDDGRPYVTAILVGQQVLGGRIGGRLGHWLTSIATRLTRSPDPGPHRIDFGVVTAIGSSIAIARRRFELDVAPLEHWVDHYVISRIPGSRHASE